MELFFMSKENSTIPFTYLIGWSSQNKFYYNEYIND